MKKKNVFGYAGIILAVVCALVLAGCPQEPENNDEKLDERLFYSWTNDPNDDYTTDNGLIGLEKTFTIEKNGAFTAKINVAFIGALEAQGISIPPDLTDPVVNGTISNIVSVMGGGTGVDGLAWTVKGKLKKVEGEIHVMQEMSATGKPIAMGENTIDPNSVKAFENLAKVQISFAPDGDGTSFDFSSADTPVNQQVDAYFGGTYTRQSQ
jgi:hypothetical protein